MASVPWWQKQTDWLDLKTKPIPAKRHSAFKGQEVEDSQPNKKKPKEKPADTAFQKSRLQNKTEIRS